MPDTSTETRAVIVEREIPFPPEKIWRALTQPHLIQEWLMSNDFAPVVDRRFSLRADWGSVDGTVLQVEPHRTLSYRWDALGLESIVTWTLTPTPRRHPPAHGTGRLPRRSGTGLSRRRIRLAALPFRARAIARAHRLTAAQGTKRHDRARIAPGQVPRADRRADRGAGRLARRDARPAPRPDPAGHSRCGRGMEVARGAGVVFERHGLHRRDLQGGGQADLRQGGVARRSRGPVQFEPSTATPGARSTSARARRSTRRH